MGFVGNYAPYGLSPQTDGMPVILKGSAADIMRRSLFLLLSMTTPTKDISPI